MTEKQAYNRVVNAMQNGQRFDQTLAEMFPEYSRSVLTKWIRQGKALLDGQVVKPKAKVLGGAVIDLIVDPEPVTRVQAQHIPLDVIHADDDIILVNKPAGLVVHPAAGNPDGTLQNALLHYDSALQEVPRAGIVHRLDKDTSGILVVARNLIAHHSLVQQLKAREISRRYLAVTQGVPISGGTIDAPIGRHPGDRKRMAVLEDGGKPAVSHFRIQTKFHHFAAIEVSLETGRTHQIRVHMAHQGFPLVGDPVYGGRLRMPKGSSPELQVALQGFRRQALHARHLRFMHPSEKTWVAYSATIPEDLTELLRSLDEHDAV